MIIKPSPKLTRLENLYFGFLYYAPVLLVLVAGIPFGLKLLVDPTTDVIKNLNAGAAILGLLASLSFGCARSLPHDKDIADRFAFAGERLFHAVLLFLL